MRIFIALGLILAIATLSVSYQSHLTDKLLIIAHNLGQDSLDPRQSLIPDGQSGVTALCRGIDNNVYGGTSAVNGKSAWIFCFKRTSNLVSAAQPLEPVLKGQSRVNNTLVTGGDGFIYGGTSTYTDQPMVMLKECINPKYEGGHLFRFKEGGLKVEDLGLVAKSEGVRTLIADPKQQKLYGLTEPSYRFFIYDLKQKKLTVRTETLLDSETINYRYIRLQNPGTALIAASDGNVYGSAGGCRLFAYDPASDKLAITDLTFGHFYSHEKVDGISALTAGLDGAVYGGTRQGFLFRFDCKTKTVKNLGKPTPWTWIRSLSVMSDGTVVGVSGHESWPTMIWKYAEGGGYEHVGQIKCAVFRTDYGCYATDLGPSVYLPEERVVIFGEMGRLGRLFVYYNN